jgi:hypothetical protein
MTPTDPADILAAVEQHLRLTAPMPFSRRDLQDFLDGVKPLVQDNPSVEYWADAFLARQAEAARAGGPADE